MKKSFLLLLLSVVVFQVNATIRRVNNNPGVVLVTGKVFADFTLAHSAAVDGDTIYIEPSDINYGGINLTKRLTIVGPGYLLNKNPNTPFDKRSAKVSSVSFNNISGGTTSSYTKIYGLDIIKTNGIYGSIFVSANINGIGVFNCIFNDMPSIGGRRECVVSNCFILGNVNSGFEDTVFSNNIIIGSLSSADAKNTIKNNIIFGGISSSSIFYNNIIYTNDNAIFTKIDIYNNVCVGCTGTPTNNNFFTTAANTIFAVTEPRTLDDLEDDNFILSVSSPAKGKGVDGVDCGIFDGLKPYILSGIPPFPMITTFTQGAISGSNLPITFSIKRN